MIRCCSGFSDFEHLAKVTKEAGLEITPLVLMDGIRGTIPINPVVHQGSRAGFCSLVWYGIGLDPLCKRTLGSHDVTVTTFGSGKWANDINVKSLERVIRRNRAEGCLGRFPGGLVLGRKRRGKLLVDRYLVYYCGFYRSTSVKVKNAKRCFSWSKQVN